jgi:TRAP-type transport system periplasmic protein
MLKRLSGIALAAALLMTAGAAHAATEIKLAILAPEGSTWHKVMTAWNRELQEKTKGQVLLKIYPGGTLGDEMDVVRKMRIGQIQAAGLTGLGLGAINPEVRVLELPMLVANYAEADAVAAKIWPKLAPGFEKNGFAVLGVGETGFINIFSNRKIASRADMKGAKMWAWEGDPLVATMYKVFNIVPIPLPITDVLTSLQTKLIDGVYAPPLGAIALQWFTQTKYYTDLKLADSTGGIVMSKKALDAMAPADREILTTTAKKYAKQLIDATRADNESSYAQLAKAGLTKVPIAPEESEQIRQTSREVWTTLVGKLYSKELLDAAIAAVTEKRGGSKP